MSLLGLISIIGFIIAPTIATYVWHTPALGPLIRLGLLIGVFGALAHVPSIYFQSLKRFHINSVVLSGQALISLSGILTLALLRHWSVQAVIVVSIITTGIGAFVFLVLIPKRALVSVGSHRFSAWKVLSGFWRSPALAVAGERNVSATESPNVFAFYMLLSSVFVMLAVKADVWLMGAFLNPKAVGVYNAAMRFTLPLVVVLNAINTALWPRASSLTSIDQMRALLVRAFGGSLVVALFGAIYSLAVPPIAPLLFGTAYQKSVVPGQVLCLGYVAAIFVCPAGVVGYALGMVRLYWFINLVQLLVVIGSLVLLLPRIGPLGAALAFVANATVGGVLCGAWLWRRFRGTLEPGVGEVK
jgi:O-antigen/teichoic acid export membrane protein